MKQYFAGRLTVSLRMLASLAALFAISTTTIHAQASSAKEYIEQGDKETTARNGDAALKAYEEALRIDSMNTEALWKAATVSVALAEFGMSSRAQSELVRNAETYARRAYAQDSTNAEAHFVMAQALGRAALLGGQMARLKYSTAIYNHAQSCLKIQPKHPGCLHIIGNWHAEVMRLSGFERKMAAMMTKSPLFDSASWDKAKTYVEQAAEINPDRAIHHIVLAQIYVDMDEKDKARAEFKATQDAPLFDFNDEKYKEMAAAGLKKLGDAKSGK